MIIKDKVNKNQYYNYTFNDYLIDHNIIVNQNEYA